MSTGRGRIVLAAAAILASLAGCHGAVAQRQRPNDVPSDARVLHYEYAGGRNVRTLAMAGGIACQADGVIGPVTYAASNAGKVRRLMKSEAAALARIRHYVASPYLRFTWLGSEFIVYDAIYGVCSGGVYAVMNGDCNELYSPTDTRFENTFAGTGCRSTPPPWKR